MDVALVIRQRLAELDLDQRDLAAAAGVTESYVSPLHTHKKARPARCDYRVVGMGSGDVRAHRVTRQRQPQALRVRRAAERGPGERAGRVFARPIAERYRDRRRADLPEVAAFQGPPAHRTLLLSGAPEPSGLVALSRVAFRGAPLRPRRHVEPGRGHLRPPREDHAPRRSPETSRP